MPFDVAWLANGRTWDIGNGAQGVKLLGGVDGLLDPEFVAQWTDRIGDGDRYRGSRLPRRSLTLRLQVGDGTVTEDAWRVLDASWWLDLTQDDAGLLDVRTSPTSNRYLRCRLARATAAVVDFDPAITGYQLYLVQLVADDPWWFGQPQTFTWMYSAAGAATFYGGSGGGGLGPPYYLSPSGGFGEQMVSNLGDIPAGPRWVVTGPLSSALLTVDGRSIAIPSPLASGQSIYIETDPPDVYGDLTESRWDMLTGAADFATVPVGATVPVTVQVTDPGVGAQVTMTLTPRHRRPW